jgi:hypothetical protein
MDDDDDDSFFIEMMSASTLQGKSTALLSDFFPRRLKKGLTSYELDAMHFRNPICGQKCLLSN